MRIIATTRGSSGRYQSLADLTLVSCDWAEFARPLVAESAGYKYNCYATIPIPIAPYGYYRVEFRISEKDNVNCYCFRLYLKVEPDAKAIRELQRNKTAYRIFTSVKNPIKIHH